VDVGVADAGVADLDEDISGTEVTALDGGADQRVGGGGRGDGIDGTNELLP
jgi:hypothetical protein